MILVNSHAASRCVFGTELKKKKDFKMFLNVEMIEFLLVLYLSVGLVLVAVRHSLLTLEVDGAFGTRVLCRTDTVWGQWRQHDDVNTHGGFSCCRTMTSPGSFPQTKSFYSFPSNWKSYFLVSKRRRAKKQVWSINNKLILNWQTLSLILDRTQKQKLIFLKFW